jgi:hypothetical protein
MSDHVALYDRRWYRVGEWAFAALSVGLVAYGVAVSYGWFPGHKTYPQSTLCLWAALACLWLSFVARRRSIAWALSLIALSILFFVLMIVEMGRGS